MRLEVEPKHEHNAETQLWLPTYVREIFDQTVDRVRIYLPNLPADPWTAFTGRVTVHLYNPPGVPSGPNNYTDGLCWPGGVVGFERPDAESKLEINWHSQFDLGKQNLNHEWQHWLAFHCGDVDWHKFGHSEAGSRVFQWHRDQLAAVHPHDQVNLWSRNAGGLVY